MVDYVMSTHQKLTIISSDINSLDIWHVVGLMHQLQLLQQMTSILEGRGEEKITDTSWW